MPDAVPGLHAVRRGDAATESPDSTAGLGLTAGSQIEVRDEEWLVRNAQEIRPGEHLIEAVGVSALVRGQESKFLTSLDRPRPLLPEHTRLVADETPNYRRSRLFLEAVMRRTPLPQSETRLALADSFLLDPMPYQLRPAEKVLRNTVRPRLLIGDVVGLGKTLEIGLILAELIRRGRGDRILIVTPAPVLTQFQQELWTRFSIPLVRLDTVGIAQITRRIPAGRNPFTYYRRAIVSMDTLKNPDRYKALLENVHWDVVVIDESHNLIGQGNQRRRLANLLADRTDALILASATPHNGKMRSFAGLLNLLDPTAIKDPGCYTEKDIKHLYIRRTRANAEVAASLTDAWAPRGESLPLRCAATDLEEEVFAELAGVWLTRTAPPTLIDEQPDSEQQRPSLSGDDRLVPYVMLKSFLSSHRALFTTVRKRLAHLKHGLPAGADKVTDAPGPEPRFEPGTGPSAEVASLRRLVWLTRRIEREARPGMPGMPAKLAGLVAELKRQGVGRGSDVRAVVFSERKETLDWLGAVVPPLLGWTDETDRGAAVRVLHSGVAESEQTRYVEEFALAASKVRLLFTGDGASEGVNLHRQCSLLLHWDLPWSLIRIEQRNGRIDRYGQLTPPQFRAMILTSAVEGALDDTSVAERLLEREAVVHRDLGTVEAVSALHDTDAEEDRLVRTLLTADFVEAVRSLEVLPTADTATDGDMEDGSAQAPLAQTLMGEVGMDFAFDLGDFDAFLAEAAHSPSPEPAEADPQQATASPGLPQPPRARSMRLFDRTRDFVRAALAEVDDLRTHKLGLLESPDGMDLSFDTPEDLAARLSVLPESYRRERRVDQHIVLTFSREAGDDALRRARASKESLWPDVSYVTDLHPVVDWLVDKVLVQLGRQQALVVRTDRVDEPVFLLQGVWSNVEGRPTVVSWMAIDRLGGAAPDGPRVRELTPDLLAELGVSPRMVDSLEGGDPAALEPLVPLAVSEARRHLDTLRIRHNAEVNGPLDAFERRIDGWAEQLEIPDIATSSPGSTGGRRHQLAETAWQLREQVRKLRTSGDALVRVLAVVEPGA